MTTERRPARRSPPARLVATAGGLALLGALVACEAPSEEEATIGGCAAAVEDASRAVEVDEQVRLLDRAMIACRSYEAFTAELERYPSIIGYDVATFVAVRCERVDDDEVRNAPTCERVIAPATTLPTGTIAPIVFVGATLDGRQIELRPEDGIEFDGDVPAVVQQTVDIALEAGCDGVIAQRDLWVAQVTPPTGDEAADRASDLASVYAQHAQNVADYIRCDAPPIVSPTESTTTTAGEPDTG